MAVRYRSNSSFCCNNHFAKPAAAGRPVHPQYLAPLIDEIASDDAIIASDVGTPTVWAARYLTTNGKRRLLFSANHGSMANALPQAIGAASPEPARQVVTMSGDGGLAMLLGDLLTLQTTRSAGESCRLRQPDTRLRGDGTEGGRLLAGQHSAGKSRFRGDRPSVRYPRYPGRRFHDTGRGATSAPLRMRGRRSCRSV